MEREEPVAGKSIVGFPCNHGENLSGVSWAAVVGGAFVTAALSVILLALGTGLGFSSISPWTNVGASASVVGTATIVWLIAMQIISSTMGGYLAGRLRTKWVTLHTHEVYFRDTVHGFLVWAVALVITASFLTAAATSMVGGTGHLTAGPAEGRGFNPVAYSVNSLFRSDRPALDQNDANVRAEVSGILVNALAQKEIPADDKIWLAQIVTAKTGLQPVDAEKRVSDVFASARESMEVARKSAAHILLWLSIALLFGAFFASYAATIGGWQRDNVITV